VDVDGVGKEKAKEVNLWKWLSVAALVAGQLSYAFWAWCSGAPWRAVCIGFGFAVLNVIIFTEPREG